METIIFTDGSSRGNPGPGGWGSVVIQEARSKKQNEAQVKELGGREERTTNNKMELMAALQGLRHAGSGGTIIVYTDSSYLIKGITQWIKGWKRNGWMTQTKEDVANKDVWMGLDEVIQGKDISWKYVGGHIGIAGNERCDEIATAFADDAKIDLYSGSLEGYSIPGILTISADTEKVASKKSSSSRSGAKAYSYVSLVGGKIETHPTWAECEKRVKGVKARFKKALNKEEEGEIMREFSS
ncbi:MAG: ribonuclease HI [Patescibacteria group bacterium]